MRMQLCAIRLEINKEKLLVAGHLAHGIRTIMPEDGRVNTYAQKWMLSSDKYFTTCPRLGYMICTLYRVLRTHISSNFKTSAYELEG